MHLLDAVCKPCGVLYACYICSMQQRLSYITQGLLNRRMH